MCHNAGPNPAKENAPMSTKNTIPTKADPRNWGRTGDLGKVRSDLIDLVGFMSGMDREHVEAFLADAE